MLQKLNERIQGVVAWVIIVLVAITFTMFGIDYYMQAHHESSAQVEVNGQPISKEAFELNYRRSRQLRDASQMTEAFESQLKQQVMNEMITNTVSMQAARSNGFEVNAAQANSAILSIPQFQQGGHFSTDRYQQALSGALYTPESFQTEVRQGMLLNQQRFAFMGTAFALPSEITQFVKLYMQTRDYAYIKIPVGRFIKQENISLEEIDAYYSKHKKEFISPEKVSVDFVRLSMSDVKRNIKISEHQIAHFYEENQSNYYTPTQWKVAHILFAVSPDTTEDENRQIKEKADQMYRALLKNPGQFEQNAKTVSDDKISAMNGGVLPWIVAGKSELDKSLVNLTTPGQILSPLKTKHGYELFKLVAYKPATIKPLVEVKGDIQEQLLTDIAQAEYAQALEQLSDLSYQTPDSLAPVAEALKLTVQQSTPFSRQGNETEFANNKQVVNAAFSHDVLELGNNSEPVQLDNESIIVLRINKRFPSAEKPLTEVRAPIVETLARIKAKAEARRLGKQLISVKHELAEQEKFMQENNLKWHEVSKATRDTDAALIAINDMAFNLPRPGAKLGRSLVGGDYVIVHLKKINDGQLEPLDKEQASSITQQIEASYGMMEYDLYISSLLKKAKIDKH